MKFDQQITFLPSTNLERTVDFYQRQLGFEMALDQGDCKIFRVRDNTYFGFCKREGNAKPENFMLTLVTEHVDEVFRDFTKKGIECKTKPQLNRKYGIYHFFIEDPNGYLIEIQRFLDPLTP